jgi:hypothetical protein
MTVMATLAAAAAAASTTMAAVTAMAGLQTTINSMRQQKKWRRQLRLQWQRWRQ